MKSKFFFFAVGALALSACTSEEVLEDAASGRNVISFENVVNKHSRADLDNSTLSAFYVYGYNITKGGDVIVDFTNTQIVKEDGVWSYKSEPRYWMPEATYNFFAYSDGNGKIADNKLSWVKVEADETVTTSDKPAAGYELAIVNYLSNATTQADLVYASKTNVPTLETGLNQTVQFQFQHLLSKVQAVFANQFDPEYDVEVSNVVIKDIHGIGSYTPSIGWYAVESSNGASVNLLADGGKLTPKATYDDNNKSITAYVIPYNYNVEGSKENVKIQFDLKITSKDEEVLNKTIVGTFNPTWNKGYSYTYNIVLSGSSANLDIISFVAQETGAGVVENWNEPDPDENPTFKF